MLFANFLRGGCAAAIFAALAFCGLCSDAQALLINNAGVPTSETSGLAEVYRFPIPDSSGGWNTAAIPYSIDNSSTTPTGYTRVAYYLEFNQGGAPLQYVYASFDVRPEFAAANQLGVPSLGPNGSHQVFKLGVSNMHVYTNSDSTSGTFATGGNLEFWPSNYGQGVNGVFDYDDDGFNGSDGHGSMQIHNGGLAQTLFSYNAWGGVRESELGIGTQVGGSNNPDWTFNTGNNNGFTATMQIFVLPVPEPASCVLLGLGAVGLLVVARQRRRA